MHRVASYFQLLQAVQAADHLIAHAIVARVVGDREAFGGIGIMGRGLFDVVVHEGDEVEPARALLASWTPIDDVDWDDTLPDLSRIDPAFAPSCPRCGQTLPLQADLCACPACRAEVDVPELIVASHGPELLAHCYEPASPVDDRLLRAARLHCPRCAYSLEGLPLSGQCPECGTPYDKRALVVSMLLARGDV
jgi:hypothetical protein